MPTLRLSHRGFATVSAGLLAVVSFVVPSPAQSTAVTAPLGPIVRVSGVVPAPQSDYSTSKDSQTAALSFVGSNEPLFGVTPSQLQLERVVPSVSGLKTLRFAQFIQGARIEGSLVSVTLSADLHILSYSATTISINSKLSLKPQMTPTQIKGAFQSAVAQHLQIAATQIDVGPPVLTIVDSRLVDQAPAGDTLAWKAMTSVASNPTSSAWSFIADGSGELLAMSRIARGITFQPNVCDLQAASLADYAGQNKTAGVELVQRITVRKTGLTYNYIDTSTALFPLCGTNYVGANGPSADAAIKNINTTWDFYKNVIGIDINEELWLGNIASTVNGDRNPRISAYINVCFNDKTSDCPNYANASWAPWSSKICRSYACSGIFMGTQYDQALDVIAHELTHGITFSVAFTDYLTDTSEAGALSEGLSDVFGESVERLSPTSTPDPSWRIGESVTLEDAPGPYREMQTGTSYQWDGSTKAIPAITNSWVSDDSHTNNGPINRLAWLLANGSEPSSPVVLPMGTVPQDGICHTLSECTAITRMNVLMYTAMSSVTSTSSYFDFGKAMINSCFSLVKTKTDGFNTSACANVQRALSATGISKLAITNTTRVLGKVRPKSWKITAQVRSLTGAVPMYLPMRLEKFDGTKWAIVAQGQRSCKTYCTSLNGNVSFTVQWPKITRYRISAVLPVGSPLTISKVYRL